MKNFLLPVILFCASLCCTALEIDPAKAVIVAPGSEKLAAGELQKHLKLITGVEIPIQGKADGRIYARQSSVRCRAPAGRSPLASLPERGSHLRRTAKRNRVCRLRFS